MKHLINLVGDLIILLRVDFGGGGQGESWLHLNTHVANFMGEVGHLPIWSYVQDSLNYDVNPTAAYMIVKHEA